MYLVALSFSGPQGQDVADGPFFPRSTIGRVLTSTADEDRAWHPHLPCSVCTNTGNETQMQTFQTGKRCSSLSVTKERSVWKLPEIRNVSFSRVSLSFYIDRKKKKNPHKTAAIAKQ